jgi:hypothetical protein
MTIYTYLEGEHPGRFIGCRVHVMVDKEPKQKYFSFNRFTDLTREQVKEKAEALNTQWMIEQQQFINKRHQSCHEIRVTDNLYTTGVRGIKMKFGSVTRPIKGKRKKKRYYTPYFFVQGQNENGRFQKKFNIITQGYDNAWTFAVLFYAMRKEITEPQELVKRLPPVEKFLVIYRVMVARGHEIPKNRLPLEVYRKLT